jgi:hypothetical protein
MFKHPFLFLVCILALAALACTAPTISPTPPDVLPLDPLVIPQVEVVTLPAFTQNYPTPSPETQRICIVTTGQEDGDVNLRAGPGMEYAPIAWSVEGAPLQLCDPARQVGNGWWCVHVEGLNVWINQNLCKLQEVEP